MVLNKLRRNKKGQQIFIGIMTAILVFITLVVLISPIKDQVTTARNSDNLNCSSSTITTGTKAGCILVDWYLPYFIAAGIAVSVGFITQRKYIQIQQ
jgi:hypothetical protein